MHLLAHTTENIVVVGQCSGLVSAIIQHCHQGPGFLPVYVLPCSVTRDLRYCSSVLRTVCVCDLSPACFLLSYTPRIYRPTLPPPLGPMLREKNEWFLIWSKECSISEIWSCFLFTPSVFFSHLLSSFP